MQDPQIRKFIELESSFENELEKLERKLELEFLKQTNLLSKQKQDEVSVGMQKILEKKAEIENQAKQEVQIILGESQKALFALEKKDINAIVGKVVELV